MSELKKMLLLLMGIPLFIGGLISTLNGFQREMNIIDWLVSDLAPNLPSQVGDVVRMVAIYLLIFFTVGLSASIEKLAKKYSLD
jgi:hypothetical protein